MFRKSFLYFFFLCFFRPKKIEKMLDEQEREKEEKIMRSLGFPLHIKRFDLPKRCSTCDCPFFYYKDGLIRCMNCGVNVNEAEEWAEYITDGTR